MKDKIKKPNKIELLAPAGLSAKARNQLKKNLMTRNIQKNKSIELLAPAGSLEKLKHALHYGADAVYCGIPDISMRARVNSFTEKDLAEAVKFVHEKGKKIFVTINIYAHNYHLPKIEKHLKFLKKINIDGIIVSDPGIINLIKKHLPEVDLHLSTQANTTNWQAVKFWHELGIKRIVLAREVTLEDIKEIRRKVPKMELEYFVHGAMCMSYSGRCILSKWMSGKSANLGDCSQPCRWGYKKNQKSPASTRGEDRSSTRGGKIKNQNEEILTMSVEDVRGEYEIELEEDLHGTYFFNSKDLNLIRNLKELKEAGVISFKIEGRNKSISYVSSVVKAYREVIDAIESEKSLSEIEKISKKQEKSLSQIMNRGYTKGFLLSNEAEHNFFKSHENEKYQFVGEIIENQKSKTKNQNLLKIKVHNAIRLKDKLEVMGKKGDLKISIENIFNEDGKEIQSAHGGQDKFFYLEIGKISPKKRNIIEPMSLLRKML